jgi:hypothetical protein
VSKGFYMEFGMDRLWETVEKLMADHNVPKEDWDTFELPSVIGYYEVRQGLKRTPLTRSIEVTKIFAVLHSTKLRMFAFVTELIVREASKCLQWGAGRIPASTKERLERARDEWKGEFLGNLIGYRHKKAPNQITGHLVEKFFAEGNRDNIIQV